MNEPKKRGRPSKAEAEAKAALVESMRMDPPPMSDGDAHMATIKSTLLQPTAAPADDTLARAQAYAMRVWSGQSDNVGRAERITRVERALQGQNLPTEGVKYPGGADDEEWSEEDMQPVTWRKGQA